MKDNSYGLGVDRKKIAIELLRRIEEIYPNAKTELSNWTTPFQFLICILLSAQTTDKQVNKVTKELFRVYPTAKDMANGECEDIEDTIRGINYFKTKAKHIIGTSKILDSKYNGEPPKDLKKLQTLPGVGYKTANVFLNDLFQSNQGIAVDTHVGRVARMYGLTKETNPDKVANDLERIYPKKDWYKVNSLFVLYGRYILKAKKPDMEKVVLKECLVT